MENDTSIQELADELDALAGDAWEVQDIPVGTALPVLGASSGSWFCCSSSSSNSSA